MTRDLYGYGNEYPDVRWPGGARLAVSLVLNVEEGAELAISAGDERNETVHEAVQPVEGAPDLCMESHFEYGARVGYWPICEMVDAFGMPLTLNACARALEAMPWVGRDAARRGYEIQCHGYRLSLARGQPVAPGPGLSGVYAPVSRGDHADQEAARPGPHARAESGQSAHRPSARPHRARQQQRETLSHCARDEPPPEGRRPRSGHGSLLCAA